MSVPAPEHVAAVVILVLLAAAVPLCLVRIVHGAPLSRLVALEALSVVAVAVLLLMSESEARSLYVDVGMVLAVLSIAGSLVFARFWGREL